MGKISLGDFYKALEKSAMQCDLEYKIIPEDVVYGEQERVIEFVRTCTPQQAHQLLHDINYTDEYFDAIEIVINRPDCDQSTAMNIVADYYEGGLFLDVESYKTMPEDIVNRLDTIRRRAWANDFPTIQFGMSQNYISAINSGMVDELCRDISHFYSLPHHFLTEAPEVMKYKKLLQRYSSPLWHGLRKVKTMARLR